MAAVGREFYQIAVEEQKNRGELAGWRNYRCNIIVMLQLVDFESQVYCGNIKTWHKT